jgi:DNA polymerase elongation subunit (family B)
MEILSRGCLFVPLRARPDDTDLKLQKSRISSSMPGASMEMTSPLSVECFKDEKSLLRRFAGIVTGKDPDMILR